MVEEKRFTKPDTIAEMQEKIIYHYDYIDEELLDMCNKFDLIISNPPYSIGGSITKSVVENVEFENYINLMPKSEYRTKKLFRHVKLIKSVSNYFEDAAVGNVLTIAAIDKNEVNIYSDIMDIHIATADERYQKYYKANLLRDTTFTYTARDPGIGEHTPADWNQEQDFFIFTRTDIAGIASELSEERDWNLKRKPADDPTLLTYIFRGQNEKGHSKRIVGEYKLIAGWFVHFNTATEKDNFTNWYYSGGKNGLMNNLIIGIPGDCYVPKILPRVDWSRPWTDEEILREFGYTEDEIKEALK